MRFGLRQRHEDGGDPVPMAPLIDIVFLTLVFFMVTSVYATLESEIDITLPTTDGAVISERMQGEIFVNLLADGRIVINEREVTIPELQKILDRVSEYLTGGSVIIRGDRGANLGRAIAILNCCKNANIQNVSFAAIREDPEGGR
jgi:biopolymer transport protein ExbD